MTGSDCQKYYTLKYEKGLITTGFFKLTRNPNYLGEVMIYSSFAMIGGRWEFWGILIFVWTALFLPRMLIKDISLRKKKGWDKYDSYMFWPKFSSSCLDNVIIYAVVITLGLTMYASGGFLFFYSEVSYMITYNDYGRMLTLISKIELFTFLAQGLEAIKLYL
mmetsp:Transcript_33103/g.32487  ORF Transcript_33103/g.32487 Transcript_33103/m.32487 type:complete len:163 (+) Transcript_33103:405-893(+)